MAEAIQAVKTCYGVELVSLYVNKYSRFSCCDSGAI